MFFCRQNEWKFVQNQNIFQKELNRGGLHLNFKGNQQFFKNFSPEMSLGWNDALSTIAVPVQWTKRSYGDS